MQDHFVGRLPQPRLARGYVRRQSRQLPQLRKEIHPALPPGCIPLFVQ